MLQKDLISIIIPVHNSEKYLENCLASVCSQSYKNIEIIAIDDASEDESGRICEKFKERDPRVKVIHNEVCQGVSATRNRGLQCAEGAYVAFLDSDDWFVKEFIQLMHINCLNADISICGYLKFSENHKEKVIVKEKIETYEELMFHILCTNIIGGYCFNKMYKRELLKEILFPTEISMGEDFVFLCQYLKRVKKFSYINRPLYAYRVNELSATQATKHIGQFDYHKISYIAAVNDLKKIFESESCSIQNYISYRVIRGNIWVLLQLIYAGDYKKELIKDVQKNVIDNYYQYKYLSYGSKAEKITVWAVRLAPRLVYRIGRVASRLTPDIFAELTTN